MLSILQVQNCLKVVFEPQIIDVFIIGTISDFTLNQ